MQRGQLVKLSAHKGEIERVVVQDLGDVLLVCRPKEMQDAEKQGRIPRAVGFPKRDMLK